jgi:hypothetical protein
VQRDARQAAVVVVLAGWSLVMSEEEIVLTPGARGPMCRTRSGVHMRRDHDQLQGQR